MHDPGMQHRTRRPTTLSTPHLSPLPLILFRADRDPVMGYVSGGQRRTRHLRALSADPPTSPLFRRGDGSAIRYDSSKGGRGQRRVYRRTTVSKPPSPPLSLIVLRAGDGPAAGSEWVEGRTGRISARRSAGPDSA